jgi:MoaA/NifB/PqqE/SkfB family radical SAM enzyme
LVSTLRTHCTDVKVSIHGDRDHHNRMVGRDAFNQATVNLRRLLGTKVPVTVQTTVVAGAEWVIDWMIAFCRDLGVRRLSILPFIPRGRGAARSGEYELTVAERQTVRDQVIRRRKALTGGLEIRWLDLTTRPVPVVEADGTVLLEGPTEAADEVLARLL